MNFNTANSKHFFKQEEKETMIKSALQHLQCIRQRNCEGNDFLGWINLPNISDSFVSKIENTAQQIRKFKTVVVIGIGGSYLGAKAIIDLFTPYFKTRKTEVLFAGQHLDDQYLSELIDYLKEQDFAIIPISKSGTTLEPAITFRLLLDALTKQFGEKEIQQRVFPITDKNKGALREFANRYSLTSFTVPDDVGGRFSILSPVGLLPIAVAGINIQQLLKGAQKGIEEYLQPNLNPALEYASVRNLLYNKGYISELIVYSNPKFRAFSEWWKQLFGESEGKQNKGIFPSSLQVTTDLHSLGQFVQEGTKCLFETWIKFEKSPINLSIQKNNDNLDNLNYLSEKSLHYINSKAEEGTIAAHIKGNVPIIEINLPNLSEYNIGKLIAFYEVSCTISALLIKVNPFNQPGVEAYKKNMLKKLNQT